MATGKSGYFDLSGTKGITLRVYWAEEYDLTANTSVVSITRLQLKSGTYSGTSYFLDGTVSVAGSAVVSMSASVGGYYYDVPTLNTLEDLTVMSGYSALPWKSKTITHADDGSASVSIAVNVRGYIPGTTSNTKGNGWQVDGSSTVQLTTIPRKSTLSLTSYGNLGSEHTIKVTQQASVFTHTITYKCGTASGTICTKSKETTIKWTPPLSLASQAPSGLSVPITLTITTYNGSTSVGSNAVNFTLDIPSSVVPSVSFTVSDDSECLGKYGKYVQGKSQVVVAVTASGARGSTIVSHTVNFDGRSYAGDDVTTEVIKGSGSLTMKVTVKDSRGRTAEASKTLTVLPYSAPSITAFKVYRSNQSGAASSSGEYLAVQFSAVISPLDNKNGAEYTVQYRKSTETNYTEADTSSVSGQYTPKGAVVVFKADTSSTYDVILTAADDFGALPKSGVGPSIKKLFSWLYNGLGWAFGKVAEFENLLDVAFDARFRGEVQMDVAYFTTATGEKEWYSPPMEMGVEYRTTERHNGKPVYAKLVDYGAFPNTGNKNVLYATTGECTIVSLHGQLSDGTPFSSGYNESRTSGGTFWVDATHWNIRILTESDMSALTATVSVKYIKL